MMSSTNSGSTLAHIDDDECTPNLVQSLLRKIRALERENSELKAENWIRSAEFTNQLQQKLKACEVRIEKLEKENRTVKGVERWAGKMSQKLVAERKARRSFSAMGKKDFEEKKDWKNAARNMSSKVTLWEYRARLSNFKLKRNQIHNKRANVHQKIRNNEEKNKSNDVMEETDHFQLIIPLDPSEAVSVGPSHPIAICGCATTKFIAKSKKRKDQLKRWKEDVSKLNELDQRNYCKVCWRFVK